MISKSTLRITVNNLEELRLDIITLIERADTTLYRVSLTNPDGGVHVGSIQLNSSIGHLPRPYRPEDYYNEERGLGLWRSPDGFKTRRFSIPGVCEQTGTVELVYNGWRWPGPELTNLLQLVSYSQGSAFPLGSAYEQHLQAYYEGTFMMPRPPAPIIPIKLLPTLTKYFGGKLANIIIKD